MDSFLCYLFTVFSSRLDWRRAVGKKKERKETSIDPLRLSPLIPHIAANSASLIKVINAWKGPLS